MGNTISIKRHASYVAEDYIEDTLNNRIEVSNKILDYPSSLRYIKVSHKIVELTPQEISNVSDNHETSSGIYVESN